MDITVMSKTLASLAIAKAMDAELRRLQHRFLLPHEYVDFAYLYQGRFREFELVIGEIEKAYEVNRSLHRERNVYFIIGSEEDGLVARSEIRYVRSDDPYFQKPFVGWLGVEDHWQHQGIATCLLDLMGEYTLQTWDHILWSGGSLTHEARALHEALAQRGKWKKTIDTPQAGEKVIRYVWVPEKSDVHLSGVAHTHQLRPRECVSKPQTH